MGTGKLVVLIPSWVDQLPCLHRHKDENGCDNTDLDSCTVSEESTAYIIFTSGSTGDSVATSSALSATWQLGGCCCFDGEQWSWVSLWSLCMFIVLLGISYIHLTYTFSILCRHHPTWEGSPVLVSACFGHDFSPQGPDSRGKPKGVAVSHRSIRHLVDWVMLGWIGRQMWKVPVYLWNAHEAHTELDLVSSSKRV